MQVCVVTCSRRVGRTVVDDIFYCVAADEDAARDFVLRSYYRDGADVSVIDEDAEMQWKFTMNAVKKRDDGHGEVHRYGTRGRP